MPSLAWRLALALAATASISPHLAAQTPEPERPPHQLDELVVVAHRTELSARESAAAITVMNRTAIEQLAARNLPDILRHVPGLILVDQDGSGERSMAIARGFFGGGETEYVLVAVDGVPINDLRSGGVDWTQVPLSSIERIEVLRGAGSTAYGDAAVGAVINIVTRRAATAAYSGRAVVGAWEDLELGVRTETPVGTSTLAVDASVDRSAGYRDHSTSTDYRGSASYRPAWGRMAGHFDVSVQRVETEDPGPLAATLAADDPRQSDALFQGDKRTRRLARIGLGATRDVADNGRLSGDVRLQLLGIDDTRTLLLAPGFGDTQVHDEDEIGLWTRVEYDRRTDVSSLVGGIELEHGAYDSRYSAPDDTAVPLSEGSGSRTKIGIYAEASRLLASRLRVFAGLRYDGISVNRESGAGAWFDQWSPRVGVNLAYRADPSTSGNLYAVWTRSFKAPTLAQLYDERLLPTGQPDEFITISNPELLPQRATGFEIGVLQKLPLKSDWIQGEVSASLYRLDLDDEIDFDLRTFRFGNILESRHDGLEVAITAHLPAGLSLTHSSTWMDVAFRSGEEAGNRLKNLPAAAMTNTALFRFGRGGQASVSHHFAGSVYLDDSNATELPGGNTFDATVQWSFGRIRAQLAGMNLADANISRVGFLLFDPVTSGQVQYVYPSAGRYLRATVSIAP